MSQLKDELSGSESSALQLVQSLLSSFLYPFSPNPIIAISISIVQNSSSSFHQLISMDDKKDEFITNLKGFVDIFLFYSKTIAVTFEKTFTHNSKPVTVSEDKVSLLKLKLEGIRLTLKKADELNLSDGYDRLWMRELRDIEYRVEDVMEQIQFEYFRGKKFQELKEELLSKASVGKRKREISLLFPSVQQGQLLDKINRITDRFREISKARKALRLEDTYGTRLAQPSPLTPTSSTPTCQLQGRSKDMNKLIELLSTDDVSNNVIPIVGMAGVGKTSLVQHVYKTINSDFQLKVWVCVSQQRDVIEVTRRIVECIETESPNLSQLDPLQIKLTGHLKDKKFLLVLDDMCDEDHEHWERLMGPLKCGAEGSRVIVTTRSMKVCKMMCPKRFHLGCLSENDSWSICSERVSKRYGHEYNLDFNMVTIGKKLAARCKGLPLAAQAVGISLSSKLEEKHWNNVLENCLLIEDETVGNILPALRVSYDYLPLHLKYCFAYCSLFPKGYIFEKNRLVQLWMAQGFIHPTRSNSLEEVGCSYFDDLVERCFFQQSPCHYTSEEKYVMHDLYHELAETISIEECNRIENYKMQELDKKVRHSSMVAQESNSKAAIQLGSFGCQDLRTFLFVGKTKDKHERVQFSMTIPKNLFALLECLRALDLSNTDIESLPDSIGRLMHLRYLSIENTKIKLLPDSIGGLFNLQTLNMKHCYDLKGLPIGMKLLDNLRHLHLPLGGSCDIWMPSGMGQMTSLQTLPLIVVKSEADKCGVEELGSLENLKGELHISGMNNIADVKFAEKADMKNKGKLEKLTLEWPASGSEETVSEVLQELKPHFNLEELIITGFCGNIFPSWLGDSYLLRLGSLVIKNCRNAEELPCLGRLPSLKYLCIQSMAKLRRIGSEFCGHASSSSSSSPNIMGFQKLETIVFKKMDAWEEWNGVEKGDFPCLKSVIVNGCEKLCIMPQFAESVNVKIMRCPALNGSESKPPCMMTHSYPLLVLSRCGNKFEEKSIEETHAPTSQIQVNHNDPLMEVPKSNNQVQASSSTPCLDSNDVDMIENGSKLEDSTVSVRQEMEPNIEIQVISNNEAIMAEFGSMLEESTIQLPVEMSINTPCSYADDISMVEASVVNT